VSMLFCSGPQRDRKIVDGGSAAVS
jgi:hypothetical protein